MRLNIKRYRFENFDDIKILWSWISILALVFIVSVIFLKIHWLWKITLISVTAVFSLIMVLLAHEQFILTKELHELIEKLNKRP